MMKIAYPIIVEGKYDKIKLQSIVDATIIETNGFGIFKKKEQVALIRQLAKNRKMILLTDSDGGGTVIRSFLKTVLKPEQIINCYIPQIAGKEKRKSTPSKEGFLGVEGIEKDELLRILSPYQTDEPIICGTLSKSDLYEMGLVGKSNSRALRQKLLSALSLPTELTPNAMLEALNLLYTKEQITEKLKTLS